MVIKQISLHPSSVALVLGAAAFLLVPASLGLQLIGYLSGNAQVYALAQLFNLDAEENIPSNFSMLLLLFTALLLAIITVLERQQASSPVSYWAILSCGFLLMAADEALSFHEQLTIPVRWLLGDDNLGIFYFSWVIPGIALVLVLALFFWRFLLRLPAKTRRDFLMAATFYIGGAIGLELIGGRFVELHGFHSLPYILLVTVEESLEMGGVIFFIWALLVYIADNYKEVRFRFEGAGGEVTIEGPKPSKQHAHPQLF